MGELGLTELLPPALHPLLDSISAEAAVAISVIMAFLKQFWTNLKDALAKKVSIVVAFVVVGGMKAYEYGLIDQLGIVAEVGIEWILGWFASTKIGYGAWKRMRPKLKETDDTAHEPERTPTHSQPRAAAPAGGDGSGRGRQHPDPVRQGGSAADPAADPGRVGDGSGSSGGRFGHQPAH